MSWRRHLFPDKCCHDADTCCGTCVVARRHFFPLRGQIALHEVRARAFAAMSERFLDELKAGRAHPAQPSMMKYYGTELNKTRHELTMAAGGSDALEWDSDRSDHGAAARAWLRTKANSIEGGTSEIQLNIIAKRILELPGG